MRCTWISNTPCREIVARLWSFNPPLQEDMIFPMAFVNWLELLELGGYAADTATSACSTFWGGGSCLFHHLSLFSSIQSITGERDYVLSYLLHHLSSKLVVWYS